MKHLFARRGFSMLETIAVLVIVGVIIGGVWLTYASVNKQKRSAVYEKAIGDLIAVTREYVSQYNETTVPNPVYTLPGGQVRNITQQIADPDKGLLPSSILQGTADPNTFVIDENIVGNILTAPSRSNPYGTGPLIGIRLAGMRPNICREILNVWGGSPDRIQASGMVMIAANATINAPADIHNNNIFKDLPANAISLQPDDISAACSDAANNALVFMFRLNG